MNVVLDARVAFLGDLPLESKVEVRVLGNCAQVASRAVLLRANHAVFDHPALTRQRVATHAGPGVKALAVKQRVEAFVAPIGNYGGGEQEGQQKESNRLI